MNIIEALKSKKRFRRATDVIYSDISSHHIEHDYIRLSITDLLAEDWEIEEEKVSISARQLKDALTKFESLDRICKELGFKEPA